MNDTVNVIRHDHITKSELQEICKIKSVFGNYNLIGQLNWIDKNLRKSDMHFLLYENSVLIAYLNLIDIVITLNDKLIHAYGVGNVCSKSKGQGYGKRIMKKLSMFLYCNNKVGYLFCKENLVDFYKKSDWIIIEKDKSKILFEREIKSMLFNFNDRIEYSDYEGNLF